MNYVWDLFKITFKGSVWFVTALTSLIIGYTQIKYDTKDNANAIMATRSEVRALDNKVDAKERERIEEYKEFNRNQKETDAKVNQILGMMKAQWRQDHE